MDVPNMIYIKNKPGFIFKALKWLTVGCEIAPLRLLTGIVY